jgi:hypothetical protein
MRGTPGSACGGIAAAIQRAALITRPDDRAPILSAARASASPEIASTTAALQVLGATSMRFAEHRRNDAMRDTHASIGAMGNIRARWPVCHTMRARIVVFLAIFLTSAGFDQASKEWARDALSPHVAVGLPRAAPGAPTDPDVPISGIRLLVHGFATSGRRCGRPSAAEAGIASARA